MMVAIKLPPVIDISHWIPVEDFRALSPMPWLILTKATQGTWLLDAQYAEYADEIRDAGIRLGAYHFMEPGNEIVQADWFCQVLLAIGLRGNEVLACDMEVDGISLEQIRRFLDRVQATTGIRPILYSSQLRLEALYPSGVCPAWLKAEWLWIAEYPSNPDTTSEIPTWIVPRDLAIHNIALWQYTDDGVISGAGGNNVDLNLINPFYAQAIGLAEPSGDPMPYQFSITPKDSVGSKVRKEHAKESMEIGKLMFGRLAFGNEKWMAPVTDSFHRAGDTWLHVLEVDGKPLDGWIAETHLGVRYATITQIGTGEEPPPVEPPVEPPVTTLPDLPVTITLGDDVTYAKQTVNVTLKPK